MEFTSNCGKAYDPQFDPPHLVVQNNDLVVGGQAKVAV